FDNLTLAGRWSPARAASETFPGATQSRPAYVKPGHGKARTHHMPHIVMPEGNLLRVSAGKADVKVTR
ncbi:hypothetical protein, partial [Paraburkholderia humisilvae]|uniref:hypothetical protein n=1 Tax=Paraburkholderia humisilvae TaxID=627669 RepID=UPI001C2ECA50